MISGIMGPVKSDNMERALLSAECHFGDNFSGCGGQHLTARIWKVHRRGRVQYRRCDRLGPEITGVVVFDATLMQAGPDVSLL